MPERGAAHSYLIQPLRGPTPALPFATPLLEQRPVTRVTERGVGASL